MGFWGVVIKVTTPTTKLPPPAGEEDQPLYVVVTPIDVLPRNHCKYFKYLVDV